MSELTVGGALGLIVGLVLGAVFFGGLWLTVRYGVSSRFAAPWFAVSLLVRIGIALATFIWIGREAPVRLVGALVGFVVARSVVLWVTRSIPPLPVDDAAREVRRGA